MKENGLNYLSDIFHSVDLIQEFIMPINSFSDYCSDTKTQSAVERQLGIIGEAVNKFDSIHPEISIEIARKIVGFRNRLIHTYDSIDPAIIWAIIKNHLIPLKEEVLEKMK